MKSEIKRIRVLILTCLVLFVMTGCGGTTATSLPTHALPSPAAPTLTPQAASPAPLPNLPPPPEESPTLVELEKITPENAAQLELLAQVGEGTFHDVVRVSPDGKVLAVAASGGILLVDAATGQRLDFFPTANAVDSLAFSPDGQRLVTAHREPGEELMPTGITAGMPVYHPILTMRNLASGEIIFSTNLSGRGCGQYAAWDLAFSPDGQMIAFRDEYSWIGHDRTDNLCLLYAIDGSLVRAIPVDLPWRTISPVVFSPDGQTLFVSVVDQTTEGFTTPTTRVHVYEAGSGSLIREFDGLGMIYDMVLSPDGARLALAGQSSARLFSTQDGSLLAEFGSHAREVVSLAFSPDGAALALGSLDGTVSLWSVPEGNLLWQTQAWMPVLALPGAGYGAEIRDLAFSPTGKVVFALAPTHTINTSGRVSALQVSDGQELYSVYGNNGDGQPGLSPDRHRLVLGGYEDGRAQVWSVVDNELLFVLEGHTGLVLAARFSPDGGQIATAALDGSIRLWRAQDGSPLATLSGHTGPVRTIQYSPDGRQLLSVADDATLRLWDPADGKLLKSIPTQTGEWLAHSMAFSPDGKSVLLATGCPYTNCPGQGQGDLRRVDLESGQIETLLDYPIYGITFSADQTMAGLYGGQGMQAGIQSGNLLARQFRRYSSPKGNGALVGTGLSPDGSLFFSSNGFGLHAWDATSGEMLALIAGSGLPCGETWVTPDQRMILIASWNGLVYFFGVPLAQ